MGRRGERGRELDKMSQVMRRELKWIWGVWTFARSFEFAMSDDRRWHL